VACYRRRLATAADGHCEINVVVVNACLLVNGVSDELMSHASLAPMSEAACV